MFASAPVGTGYLGEDRRMHPMGGLGWSPETFWRSTLVEFAAAFRGRSGPADNTEVIDSSDARRIARERGYKIFGEGG